MIQKRGTTNVFEECFCTIFFFHFQSACLPLLRMATGKMWEKCFDKRFVVYANCRTIP